MKVRTDLDALEPSPSWFSFVWRLRPFCVRFQKDEAKAQSAEAQRTQKSETRKTGQVILNPGFRFRHPCASLATPFTKPSVP